MQPSQSGSTGANGALEGQPRVDAQLELFRLTSHLLPREASRYFAHLAVTVPGGRLDVLFAPVASARDWVESGRRVLVASWQRSPWLEVLYECREGDRYRLESREGVSEGSVMERNFVAFSSGELSAIVTERACYVRSDGGWHPSTRAEIALEPRGERSRSAPASLIDVHLDEQQRRAVELAAARHVLLLGEAGHGKTTVALHRLSFLEHRALPGFRAVVLVPTEGLVRLLQSVLKRLGTDVQVERYDRWARRQAAHVFADLPEREATTDSAASIRVKRDPALRVALAQLAKRRSGRVDDDRDAPLLRTRAHARVGDLQHLFGDRRLMNRVAEASSGRIRPHMVAEVLERTRVQFSLRSEQAYAHVDRERLTTIDGRSIDDATPMGDAGSIDSEDCAVLFELDRLRAERKGLRPSEPPLYDAIVVDEAQEFAALELALVGRSIAPGGVLIVAGDADQQLDEAVCFEGWSQVMRELGCSDYERVVLEVGYRCPPRVVQIARGIVNRGPASRVEELVELGSESELVDVFSRAVRGLREIDPGTSIAVICRTLPTARRLQRLLAYGVSARLVADGRFSFQSAVQVTTVDQVKGLEFDIVLVPDASAAVYPDTPEARRALYVAVTRARRQLILACAAGRSPLLA